MLLSHSVIKFHTDHFEINYGTVRHAIRYKDVAAVKIVSKLKFASGIMMVLPFALPVIIFCDPEVGSNLLIFWFALILALIFFFLALIKREKIHYLNIEIKDCKDVRFFIEPEQLKAANNILSRLEAKLKICV